MKPAPGLVLGNRYRLVSQIAVGGMGEVWVAGDIAIGHRVAVKVLREEYAGNEDFLARLRTEARNGAALCHRNIAQMFDYGEENGSGYLVMELVEGEPMADLLERSPVISPDVLLPLLSQTARGLSAAHEAGVVHRDVKPGNILIDHHGVVKLTDFGVSLAANQVPMTATGMVMGTAQYLSPEQAIGQAATGASDVYALGIVAYESVVGRRPFTGRTPVDIAVAHVNEPVPDLPAHVDEELAALIMAMLEKDPLLRPQPAHALARVLDTIHARLTAPPPPPVAVPVTDWGYERVPDDTTRWADDSTSGRLSDTTARRGVTGPEDWPDDATTPAHPHAPRYENPHQDPVAPVITPIVIPAAVRRAGRGAHSAPRRERRDMLPTWPAIRDAAKSSLPIRSARFGGNPEPDIPPVHHPLDEPTTRVERRRAAETTSRRTPQRANQRSTKGSFKLPGGLSWPLIGLAVLIAVLLIATIASRARAETFGALPAESGMSCTYESAGTSGQIVTTSLPCDTDSPPTDAMMAQVPHADAYAVETTPKDE